jgi:hypothetical protein
MKIPYLNLLICLTLFLMAFPMGNWLKVRAWSKNRNKNDAWLLQKTAAQHYLEKYHTHEGSKTYCSYCGSEKIHKRVEFSIPAKIIFGFFSNSEVGLLDYESYRCVSCSTELYRNIWIANSTNHSASYSPPNQPRLQLFIRELLYRLRILFSVKQLSTSASEVENILPQLNNLPLDRILNFSSPIFSGVENTSRLNELLDEAKTLVGAGFYQGDNFFSWFKNNSPLEDERFFAIFQENALNQFEKAILWRFYIQVCAASHCIHLNGDFVECGVSLGTEIKNIVSYLGGQQFPKIFWAYDEFHADGDNQTGSTNAIDRKDLVTERLLGYPQVKIISGSIIQSLELRSSESIAYLHLSVADAKIELAALDCLFDRVVPGGIILLNAYEWSGSHREHKMLEDQWFAKKDYRVFPLPTGQGLVIKR